MTRSEHDWEPGELGSLQRTNLGFALDNLSAVLYGEHRWMPLNEELQKLIDAGEPFDKLVECARNFLEFDNLLQKGIIGAELGLLGLKATATGGSL